MSRHFIAARVVRMPVLTAILLSLVGAAGADVIRPRVDRCTIAVGASGVRYDSATGLLTVSDDTAAFTYRDSVSSPAQLIYNLSGDFGGSYTLHALFTGLGAEAPLDGMFGSAGINRPDLVIAGEIPSLGITLANRYTGTLLEANVLGGELFGWNASNSTAELNLFFEVLGGDLVRAGIYSEGLRLGELSSVFTFSPSLPAGFDFTTDFDATFQSAQIGLPEPATLTLASMGLLGGFAAKRLARRKRR